MQDNRSNSELQRIMTITVSGETLKGISEAELLRIALAIYSVRHPKENPRDGLAALLKCSKGLIVKSLDGEGHLGGERWLVVERELGVPIYREWLTRQIK